MRKIKEYLLNVLTFAFGRLIFFRINILILKIILKFIGYNNHKNFEFSGEINFLKKICKKKPKLCVDIGANIGNYSLFLLENSKAKVIAFEPMPNAFNNLIKIKKKFMSRFFIYNIGLGNKIERKKLNYNPSNLQWSNFNPEVNKINYLKYNNKNILSKITTLDYFVKKNKILFKDKIFLMKIDTEGYEYEVLQGALKAIKKLEPYYIHIEYNWHHLFKNVNLYHLSKLLPKYKIYKILPFGNGLANIDPIRPEHNYFNYSNFIFKKK
jgi:FkbM family methyltransferase